jgi:hypothetical protein
MAMASFLNSNSEGSFKGFLRTAAERGRAARQRDESSVPHPEPSPASDVMTEAVAWADRPDIQRLVMGALRLVERILVRDNVLSAIVSKSASSMEEFLPHLPADARRDLRASFFLAAKGLESVPSETLVDVIEGVEQFAPAERPLQLRQFIGLLAIVVFAGLSPTGDRHSAGEAARELWRIARSNEPAEAVEDAWDLAVYHEGRLERGEPVPFERAAG